MFETFESAADMEFYKGFIIGYNLDVTFLCGLYHEVRIFCSGYKHTQLNLVKVLMILP